MHAPGCENKEQVRLLFLHKIGDPPGDPKHNIGYDHDLIEICPSCNGATLEKLRHDCFDFEEVWDQYEWYELSPEDGARLRAVAARCTQPLNPFCSCTVHKSLRSSAGNLPASSWSVVFEWSAHRHVISLTDGPKPAFHLVSSGVAAPKASVAEEAPQAPKETDAKAVLFVVVAWPLTFAAALVLWFRALDLPWFVDALYTILMLPVSFIVSGTLVALASVLLGKRSGASTTKASP